MILPEVELLIIDVMMKAALYRPEDLDDEAEWVRAFSIYFIELFKRARIKHMSLEDCRRTTFRAFEERVRNKRARRLLNPGQPLVSAGTVSTDVEVPLAQAEGAENEKVDALDLAPPAKPTSSDKLE